MIGVTEMLLFALLLLAAHSHRSPDPSCIGSRAPFMLDTRWKFCTHSETPCNCDSADHSRLHRRFQAMNISDPDCAAVISSVLCSMCDQFSAKQFLTNLGLLRNISALCNSTNTIKKHQLINSGAATDFCTHIRNKCADIPIFRSPSFPSMKNKSSTSLDLLPSKLTFCEAFGKSSEHFNGKATTSFSNSETSTPPNGLCFEKINNGSYINMVPHPDGSNRVFLSNQQGQIWLATIPEVGSRNVMKVDEANLFLDLSDQVLFGSEFGVMGIAFHPNFARNGRFFVSFNCDKLQHAGCQGRCSCNTDVSCDPAKLDSDKGIEPCQYHTAISEFTANGTTSKHSLEQNANPVEVRRIFTMGLPYRGRHGGQILFGPADGYLYLMIGDGSSNDDPFNFAQNKKCLLGKILRLDIDRIPSAAEVRREERWGYYSIPKDNPYTDDRELEPEIWAVGFRNPWRCSFDSERPSYFLCGDCGQDQYEEIDMIKKGGNYGWRVFEGPYQFNPTSISQGTPCTSPSSITPIFPVMGYNHTSSSSSTADHMKNGPASITGGYFYRSATDPCMYGRYLYTDLYGFDIWASVETPENSGNFTSHSIPFGCAHQDSPIPCNTKPAGISPPSSPLPPALGYVFSLAEDNKKDVYFLTSNGVYRVARPTRCKYKCSKSSPAAAAAATKGNDNSISGGLTLLKGACKDDDGDINMVMMITSASSYVLLILLLFLF